MKKTTFYTICTCLILFCFFACDKKQPYSFFKPGAVWFDSDGVPINAHGGGILFHNGKYYWYGEYKGDSTYRNPNPNVASWECYRTEAGGVSCYSSKDLYHWKFEGLALRPEYNDPKSDLHPSKVLERPKVIYNDKTGKFVMWLHVDSDDYWKASAGVAVSDSPTGQFNYLGSMRPNGQISRDMTLYKDDDGRAYLLYSSEGNATLHISLLSDDYLQQSGTYTRNFPDKYREAPAVFRRNNKFYLLSSGCSGWDPNEAEYAVADSLLGKWTVMGNPCIGDDADKTFYAQSTFIFPVQGKKDAYIAMFDRWNKTNLIDSRYVWLPISFRSDSISIEWEDNWSVDNKYVE